MSLRWVPGSEDMLILVIGHGSNKDGKLQAGEVTHVIGKCKYIPGRNKFEYEAIDGGYLVHHYNFKDTNGNYRWDPGEPIRH